MSPLLVAMVLSAAILHAGWNAMAKSGGSALFSIASYQLVGTLVCAVLIWFVPFPEAEAWPWIIASLIIHTAYYFTLAGAYRHGDLSLVYPLFRGLAPVLVAIGAALVAGEVLTPSSMLGVGLVSLGLISLTLFAQKEARPTRGALVFGLTTSVLIAAYTVVDGMGVRSVSNSLSYIFWLFFLECFPVCIWLLITDRKAWFAFMRERPLNILFGGVASSTAYGLVIFAMSLGAMALVSSLRETSVIFAALIGAIFLKESFGRQRIIAATVVAIGVVIIRYFGSTA